MEWTTATVRVPAQPFLDSIEVAALAKVKIATVRKWVREGRFPAPRRPGVWSGMAVGMWLAWQDYVAGADDDGGENDEPDEPPVKGKSKILDVRQT